MKHSIKKSMGFFSSIIVLGIISFAFSAGVLATKPNNVPNPDLPSEKKAFSIPETAKRVSPGVYSLGKAHENGKEVEGYAIVDYKKGQGKPGGCNNNGVCQGWEDTTCADCEQGSATTDTGCYSFLTKDAKWKVPEPYVVKTDNTSGLTDEYVRGNLEYDISKWEDAADGLVDGNINNDILGDEIGGDVDGADMEVPDGKNELYFTEITDDNVIAVTIIWGIFQGPPRERELIEWDQVYNDTKYSWSSEGGNDSMVFENIATHELGHSFGLDDLYQDSCMEETMYGYAETGETKKMDLSAGDIAGISTLYK